MTDTGGPGPQRIAPRARPLEPSRYDRILEAAAELFRSQGYAATSVAEVAAAAGLLKGSVYHYIRTKEDLLAAIIEEAHAGTGQLGEELRASQASAVEKLRTVIERHLRGTEKNLVQVQVLFREFSTLPPERFAAVVERRDTYERAVRELVRQGQAEGVFAAHLDPRLTAAAVLATLNSVQAWYRPDGPMSMTEIIDGFTDLLLRSVGVETHPDLRRPN
ncbi:TetR/AcrR family transcriptional regulator [Pseudonocardia sp. WMMC193]|uniref:TetR/AcrR family transcriptional regulator n=1 Tax=Pseudonocardia sp. WMMC193 TaxID=2911965 RepID=UPI001F1B73F0|nr:TetR/AcrR family transcriptional regulator [Pseudonocardia sp. WMMC193]MCF7549411.1 TetR/AcrR family transcriptional regulator [Pseudonocardia sp. WMMC193]